MQKNLFAGALLITLISITTSSRAEEGVQIRSLGSAGANREEIDREVDKAALSAQDSSINRLTLLLKKYAGNGRQEPILLSKLGELQQQKSSILFRIAHGAASKKGSKLDLSGYHKSLQQTISTLNLLIGKYPGYPDIASAYFARGKSYEEMENKPSASKDYLFLVKNFPEAEQTSAAYMSLAEFAIEANDHPRAITYLKELEKRPEDQHYPFALYKLAWSYYNLKDVAHALAYAEKQVAYYNAKFPDLVKDSGKDRDKGLEAVNSDLALRENTLVDIPLFYFQGVEDKNENYKPLAALEYFRKIENGPVLGKMAHRFAKLLRSRNMGKELIEWKNQFLEKDAARPEVLDTIIITYEYQQNQRDFTGLVETAKDILTLYKKVGREAILKHAALAKAQKMILDTAENLQNVIVKNKATEKARELSVTLAALYDTFTQVVVESDPRVPQVHYNLAETLFTIQNYDGATEHYRWIVDHWKSINKTVMKGIEDSPMKAIAARYEVLREKKLIPTEIKAVALQKEEKPKTLDPLLSSWVQWIDTLGEKLLSDAKRLKKSDAEPEALKTWDNFNFEANRVIYVFGSQKLAVERLEEFAMKRPQSAYGIPSASLVLDTFVAGSDWDGTFERATAFGKLAPWQKSDFGKRLYELAADSLYKKLELRVQAKQYDDALKDADDFLAHYKDSARIPDCLSLAGMAALSNGDKPRATGYLTQLIRTDKNPERVSDALLVRATLQEEKYEFSSAVMDYRAYLAMVESDAMKNSKKKPSSGKIEDYKKKTLALAWLADAGDLKSLLDNKQICTPSLASECDKYRAISVIQQGAASPLSADAAIDAFNRVHKMDSGEVKTLWSIYVLQAAKHLAFRDRNHILRAIGSGWKDLDPLTKFFALPYLNGAVAKAFDYNRVALKDVAPLRANEKYITHRVDSIREIENAVTKIMDLPWSRVRAETLNELASVYLDLSKGLTDLPPPKGLNDAEVTAYQETMRKLTLPFEDKANEIRSKAFEMASRFSIEGDALNSIAQLFFTENPSQAKKLKSMALESSTGAIMPRGLKALVLGPEYFPLIDKQHEIAFDAFAQKEKAAGRKADDAAAQTLLSAWKASIKKRNWVQVAFFLQEAKERKFFSDPELGLIRSVSLASAGARGEGLAELEETMKSVDAEIRPAIALSLAHQYEESFAAAKAKSYYAGFVPPAPAVADAKDVKSGAQRAPASKN